MDIEIKDLITWAIAIVAIFMPVMMAIIGFLWKRIERLEGSLEAVRRETIKEVKDDIKSMTDSMVNSISVIDARLNELMLNMINGPKK